jgi:hypothetical protein
VATLASSQNPLAGVGERLRQPLGRRPCAQLAPSPSPTDPTLPPLRPCLPSNATNAWQTVDVYFEKKHPWVLDGEKCGEHESSPGTCPRLQPATDLLHHGLDVSDGYAGRMLKRAPARSALTSQAQEQRHGHPRQPYCLVTLTCLFCLARIRRLCPAHPGMWTSGATLRRRRKRKRASAPATSASATSSATPCARCRSVGWRAPGLQAGQGYIWHGGRV